MDKVLWAKNAEMQQIKWRESNKILSGQKGKQNGVTKDYILPSDQWLCGTWEDTHLRNLLEQYLEVQNIQANQGKHNLKSSWTQCANLLFPFRYYPQMKYMLASFLKREFKEYSLDISRIDDVELEYAAPGKLSPEYLLGEAGGKRGSGQTSPDVAITFTCSDGKCGIYLIENKYTEHYFYPCSATKKNLSTQYRLRGLAPNLAPERCKNVNELVKDPINNCHQVTWGRNYWPILLNSINRSNLQNLHYCPAMKDGYQLFRQQALAQGIADSGLFDYVFSGVAYDKRNLELIGCLSDLGMPDFRGDWPRLFKSSSQLRFHCFSHQDLVAWVTRSRSSYIQQWGKYVCDRYGY